MKYIQLPAVYLDSAPLIQIQRLQESEPAVVEHFQEVFQEARLCLSHTTIMELSRPGVDESLLRLARVIDGVSPLWMTNEPMIETGECFSFALSPEAGPFGSRDVASDFIVDALVFPKDRKEFLYSFGGHPTFTSFLERIAGRNDAQFDHLIQSGSEMLGKLRIDRLGHIELRTNFPKGLKVTETKWLAGLEVRLKQIHNTVYWASGYLRVGKLLIPGNFVAASRQLQRSDFIKFPFYYMRHRFISHRSNNYPDIPASRFSSELQGEVGDFLHLAGAAYCLGFSCDKRTGEAIRRARSELGLARPLVLRGTGASSVHNLLNDISEQWQSFSRY